MFGAIAKAVFGSANDRYVRSLDKVIATINALEPQLESFSDEELAAQTGKFREQLAAGKKLDDILPEAPAHRARRPDGDAAGGSRARIAPRIP